MPDGRSCGRSDLTTRRCTSGKSYWLSHLAALNSRLEFTSPTLKASKCAVSSPKNSSRISSSSVPRGTECRRPSSRDRAAGHDNGPLQNRRSRIAGDDGITSSRFRQSRGRPTVPFFRIGRMPRSSASSRSALKVKRTDAVACLLDDPILPQNPR